MLLSRNSDNSSSKMFPVVHTKLKHLTCTNCKHAFPSRGGTQYRGKLPLLLECGHAICETCVKTCPTKNCATCGIVYEHNLNEKATFPVNLYLLGLLNANQSIFVNSTEPNIEFQLPTAARFRKSLSEDIEHCSECGLKADFRCRQCEVFFCNTCYAKIHGRALQGHQKISVSESASDISNFLSTKCELHPNEIIQFQCIKCDVPACTHCLLLSHQGHSIISQNQKTDESQAQIEDAIEKLAETLQRVKMTEKKLARPLGFMDTPQGSETDKGKIEARITQHFTFLHGVLQNIEHRYLTQLQQRQNFIGNNINTIKEQLKEQKNEIENAILLATSALRTDCPVNVTAVIDKLEEALNMPCHLVYNSFSGDNIQLDIDESIVNSLKEHCSIILPPISSYSLARTEELPDDYEIEPITREPEIPRPSLPAIKPSLTLSRSSLSMSMLSLRSTGGERKQNGGPVEGTSEVVVITHIKNPSFFYTQSVCRSDELLKLQKSLAKQAAISPIPNELELNKMYLVQYENDMKWYRGRIKSLYTTDTENSQVCDIFYVDYGNTESAVPVRRMRNMSVQNSLTPIMARQCTLHDIVPKNGQWEIEANKAMYEMIDGISHTIMHVFKVCNGVYHVDIMKNSLGDGDYTLSIRDALIFLEYGCFITNERLRKTNQQSLRKFFEEEIAISNTYDVRPTHIESPDCIYVQKIGDGMTHLNKLTMDMMEEYGTITTNKGIIYTPLIGMPCAALYDDGKWYRGRINNLLGNRKVEVFFVDFGDKREYEYQEIRRLHYKFMSYTALAFRISLKDLAPLKHNEWSIEIKQFMNENLMSKCLKIFVFSKESDSYRVTVYIPLENKDINFNALLAKENLALSTGSSSQFIHMPKAVPTKKRKRRVPKHKKFTKLAYSDNAEDQDSHAEESDPFRMQVNILHVVSPDCIYVSDIESTKLIKKMTEDIQDFYNKYKSAENEEWEKDDICIAYSAKDKSYHRSKIIDIISQEKVIVFLYDIGITETVAVQDLQSLHPEFSILPAKALKMKLAGILPCGGSATWLSSSCEALSDLICENQHSKFYISKAAGIEDDATSVELWVRETRTEGPLAPTIVEINSINKKLVKKGVALPVRGYKDEKDNKVLAVDLRQQLLQNDEKNMSADVQWIIKKEPSSSPSDATSERSAAGSSMGISERDNSTSEDENPNEDDDADVESEEDLPLPPPGAAWIPPARITDDRFCAVSTNVDQNCTIYLHSLKQNGDTLAHIDEALQTRFDGSEPKACDMLWAPGDLCIAQYHADKKWYRAQILEVLDNDEVKVIFVDYGNIDECKIGTLRKRVAMGHIPIQATKCKVQGLLPGTPDGRWTTSELDIIHALLVDKKSDVTVLDRTPEHLVVSMTLRSFKNVDLITYLRYELDFKLGLDISGTSNQERSNDVDSEVDNADVVVEGSVEDFTANTLLLQSTELFNLGSEFQSIRSSEAEEEEEAMICDEIITRSKTMEKSDKRILIIELDAGVAETSINSDSIVALEDAECASPGGDRFDEKKNHSTSTPQNEEEEVYHDDLEDLDDLDHDDLLPAYSIIDIPDDVGIVNLEPQFISAPIVFYARLDKSSNVENLDTYEKQFALMTRHMKLDEYNPPKLNNIRLNSPCCARYTEDNQWYRAIITEIDSDSNSVRVQYVDYGNSEYQPIDKIHSLAEAWLALPIMCLKCRLWRVRVNPDKPSWRMHIDKFERVFYQGVVTARIMQRSEGFLDVELYSDENCSKLLYDYLLDDGLLELSEEE